MSTLASRYNMGEGGCPKTLAPVKYSLTTRWLKNGRLAEARASYHSAEARRTDCALFQPIRNYYQRRALLRLESCT